MEPVSVHITDEIFPTYLPAPPDRHPMFLEKRVYQGSSGRVYPLPCTDRIAETPTDRAWKAIWLENEYLRVMVLPEIGGRIHVIQDKTNGFDLIYRQTVIKPALVGLAGPWVSGGIEFNWPQHHRPATFLPVEFAIEEHADGSKTVWLGDHDPLSRLKGMHGVCLHPGKAWMELKVRVTNRTPLAETFLWWANAAARVHEGYQSFFPPDVYYVADHAKRAMASYPLCEGRYYGVDYGTRGREGVPPDERPTAFVPPHCGGAASGLPLSYAANDLSWYANIPVPTSYMCMGSQEDFLGGYDHFRQAGVVMLADHHIAPGKKQWTWGNHEFGYAWDRNLTDSDGPYIELMTGVYTDNQPDFSFLQTGETRTWRQYWYPIHEIGPAQHANLDAAVSIALDEKRFRIGVSVTAPRPAAVVRLESPDGDTEWEADSRAGQVVRAGKPPGPARLEAGRNNAPRVGCQRPGVDRLSAAAAATGKRSPRPAAGQRAAAAPRRGRQRRALYHRAAPGAIPARHALADRLLARGPAARSGRQPRKRRDGGLASSPRRIPTGGKALPRGDREADFAESQSL